MSALIVLTRKSNRRAFELHIRKPLYIGRGRKAGEAEIWQQFPAGEGGAFLLQAPVMTDAETERGKAQNPL